MREETDFRLPPKAPGLRLAALATAITLVTLAAPTLHRSYGGWVLVAVFAIGGGGAFYASQLGASTNQRLALIVILAGAVLMRLAMLFVEPYLSTDIYRYVWDGRVQAAGINPYRYVPSAPELAQLRDTQIFPNINRADYAVTIYPPIAQTIFLAVTRAGESVVVMKLGFLAFEAGTVAAILALLACLDLPANRVAAYAWHPLPVWEIAGHGHVDAAMCAFLMGGLLLYLRGRTYLAGAALTLGALVKPTALLVLPVLWRPWNWRLPLVVLLTAVAAYVPYLSVGSGVIGYLPGYLEEEGLRSGRGINLLWLTELWTGPIPQAVVPYMIISGGLLIVLALAVAFRRDRSAQTSISSAGWLLIAFLVVASPHYPWYFLPLVPFLALAPSTTAWVLTLGSPLLYNGEAVEGLPDNDVRIALLMAATIVALAHDFWRARRHGPLLVPLGEAR